jgi:hypothetical protein
MTKITVNGTWKALSKPIKQALPQGENFFNHFFFGIIFLLLLGVAFHISPHLSTLYISLFCSFCSNTKPFTL